MYYQTLVIMFTDSTKIVMRVTCCYKKIKKICVSHGKKKGKLHFTTLNYASSYTLHLKLFERTLCILNYHTYHTLHPGITVAVIFNGMLLHMTSTCILLGWNKLKRLKHPTSKSFKTKPNFFHILFFQLFKIFGEKSACFHPLNEQLQQATHLEWSQGYLQKILAALYIDFYISMGLFKEMGLAKFVELKLLFSSHFLCNQIDAKNFIDDYVQYRQKRKRKCTYDRITLN